MPERAYQLSVRAASGDAVGRRRWTAEMGWSQSFRLAGQNSPSPALQSIDGASLANKTGFVGFGGFVRPINLMKQTVLMYETERDVHILRIELPKMRAFVWQMHKNISPCCAFCSISSIQRAVSSGPLSTCPVAMKEKPWNRVSWKAPGPKYYPSAGNCR